jgi:hypothetical protein
MLGLCTIVLGVSLAAAAPSPGPTLATEDTMHTQVPEVLVTAPRVTLAEILDRVARGEARRDSLLEDQVFTATLQIVRLDGDRQVPLQETVARVYKKRPDFARSVVLKHWTPKSDEHEHVEVDFRADMSEEVVNFAFRPEARRDFKYHIVGRDIVGDHVIYRIAFEPRSPIDRAPSGVVWVDTNDFVIVRQEVSFTRSPVPLILKDVNRMVIERKRVQGHWVLSRVLLRAEMTIPLPKIGRAFDVTLRFDDYAINQGLDDSIFKTGSAR